MINLLFGVPVFHSVLPRAFSNFMAMAVSAGSMLKGTASLSVRVHERDALVTAMNTYGKIVLEHNFDALVIADDDCLPPIDAIPRLVEHLQAGRDYVAAVGYMRGYPHTTTIGRYLPEGRSLIRTDHGVEWKGFQWLDDLTNAPPLIRADFCGVPIAIISRRCFEKAEYPWFARELDGGEVTHDVFFAHRLKAAGIEVLVDTTMRCDHIAEGALINEETRRLARLVGAQMAAEQKGQAA